MEFDKPDKEVQRPRGNDVADQACSRSCGWRGELREPSAVAAAASTAEEHATREPPQKCLKWQLHIRVSSTALQVYHARRLRSSPLSSGCVSDWLFPRNFIK